MKKNSLFTNKSVIVHRGLSDPLCPYAERTQLIANSSEGGFSHVTAVICCAVSNVRGDISIQYLFSGDVSFKRVGEPNIVINQMDSPFYGWWCHMIQVDGEHFGLIGRPNRRFRLGPKYTIPFDHKVSTTDWKVALSVLPTFAQDWIPELKEIRFPRLAATFDASRSPLSAF